MTTPRKGDLLTVKQFADITNEHPRSIYRRISQGRQRGAIPLGRDWRIDVRVALAPAKTRATA